MQSQIGDYFSFALVSPETAGYDRARQFLSPFRESAAVYLRLFAWFM